MLSGGCQACPCQAEQDYTGAEAHGGDPRQHPTHLTLLLGRERTAFALGKPLLSPYPELGQENVARQQRSHLGLAVGAGGRGRGRGVTVQGLTTSKTQMVRPTQADIPRCGHHRTPEPRTLNPVQRDTHQQTSPATTAVQVTQQESRRLVCTASSCRQQHTQTT